MKLHRTIRDADNSENCDPLVCFNAAWNFPDDFNIKCKFLILLELIFQVGTLTVAEAQQ